MNSTNRRWNKALKELGESKILVEYLLHHNLSFSNIANFSDSVVKQAIIWNRERVQ